MKFHSLMCVVVVAATACGDDSVEIGDFQARLADAYCKNAVTCQNVPDMASCKAAIQLKSRLLETLVARVNTKVIKYDGGKAAECFDYIDSAGCAFTGFYPEANPCDTVFTGTVAAGGACTISNECAADGTCERTDPNCDPQTTCCPGTCKAAPTLVALGGDCTSLPCVDTAYCDSTTNKCTAPITTAGAACTDFDACANPMICDVFATAPTCITPAARGATCDPMALFGCADQRDYCDTTTTKCTQNVAIGTACGGANGATCIGYADCNTNMVCVALGLAGAACTTGSDSSCLGDLQCPSGSCTLPAPEAACRFGEAPATTPQPPVATARRLTKRTKLEWMPKLQDAARERPLRALR
jgi:hypothetical protein